MDAEVYNGYWISTDTYLTQAHRDENAELIANYLLGLAWTKEAVAGVLGNMDVESSMNPALIEGRGYHSLINNQQCLQIDANHGVGLVQWTGHTSTTPAGQKLASFAIRYDKNWYDGDLQCFRLKREWDTGIQFNAGTVDGVYYNWQLYVTSTNSPEVLAKVWQVLYERGGTDTTLRQQKARYYYNKMNNEFPVWLLCLMKKKGMILCRRM